MWELYRGIIHQYSKILLVQERRLIAKAQKGCIESEKEIILRHIGFLIFRIRRKLFPEFLNRYGEDLLAETIPVLYQKIKSYDLKYRDRNGNPKPVRFSSYIWKRVDGFIIDFINEEIQKEKLASKRELVSLSQNGVEDDGEMV